MSKLEQEILGMSEEGPLKNLRHSFLLNKSPEEFELELIKDLSLDSLPNQVHGFKELFISEYSLYRLILAGKIVEIIPVIKISNTEQYIYVITDKKLSSHLEKYLTFDNLKKEKDEYEVKKQGVISHGEMIHLYVLELEDDCRYVGITKNVQEALKDHQKGFHEFTKKHKPIKILSSRELKTNDFNKAREKEDLETQKLMREFGIDKVRGGKYVGLSSKDIEFLLPKNMKKKIRERNLS